MNIGICGPFNPSFVKEFFYENQNIPNINKAASAVNTFVKELLLQGHRITVVTCCIPGISNDVILRGNNLTVHIVHSDSGLFLTHGLSRFYMVRRLKKVLNLYVNELDILHAQWTYDFALASKSFADKLPVFCTIRDWCPYIMTLQNGMRKLQWKLYHLIFRKVMRGDKIHFIANSKYTYDCVMSEYPQKEVETIFNPIDRSYIIEEKRNVVIRPTFITIAGSIGEKRKNIVTLLKAFHIFHLNHPDSILKIVGGGCSEDNPLIKAWKAEGLLDGVELIGYLTHKQLIEEIDKCSCLVHPSLEETFGNIFLEGMSRCLPVIGGVKAGAVPYVLDNGRAGFLCDVTSVESINEALERACDSKTNEEVVTNATNLLKTHYASNVIVEKHINLYKKYLRK